MAGIYIHIPYCHSKCAYCDFYSSAAKADKSALVDCLIKEWTLRRDEVDEHIHTIYLGGGTPSILDIDEISRLVKALPVTEVKEFTIEANPEDISVDKVKAWRDLGVNRVSMGVQSLVDAELRLIGRRHDADTAIQAAETIRDTGINNISLDLIYGLPTQTIDTWTYTLDRMLNLNPEHLSAYILSYEPKTKITQMLNQGKIEAISDEEIIEMYHLLIERTRNMGYEHYEISNFARKGYRAVHNSNYWNGTPYVGIGPAAHGYDGKSRKANPANIRQYIESIRESKLVYEVEVETKAERYNSLVITSMRTSEGLDYSKVPVIRRRQLLCDAYPFVKSGQLVWNDNHLVIPESHWLISDSIMRELMQ